MILFLLLSARGIRGVWTFTLRDSEEDFINVTVWGSVEFIEGLTQTFHIGSIGEYIFSIRLSMVDIVVNNILF